MEAPFFLVLLFLIGAQVQGLSGGFGGAGARDGKFRYDLQTVTSANRNFAKIAAIVQQNQPAALGKRPRQSWDDIVGGQSATIGGSPVLIAMLRRIQRPDGSWQWTFTCVAPTATSSGSLARWLLGLASPRELLVGQGWHATLEWQTTRRFLADFPRLRSCLGAEAIGLRARSTSETLRAGPSRGRSISRALLRGWQLGNRRRAR
eukprot:scaffold1239_cov175-Pinguiococcus_pyrenoidosus.AAC.13